MKYTQQQLALPLMQTLKELGGKASTNQVYDSLAKRLKITEDEKNKKLPQGNYRIYDRTVRWCKETLKTEGMINTPTRGIWQLTEKADDFLKNAKPGVLLTVYEVINERDETVGYALWGEAMAAAEQIQNRSLQMVMTSPPYALVTPRQYGNKSESEYIEWFIPMARQIKEKLKDDGSFVLNLGPTFKKGVPVKSLYTHRLLLALCDEVGFHLAQEFYWHNNAKLPVGTWVTVERVRVTDSIENIYWLSKTPYPKADNKNILLPYTEEYKKALANGGYKVQERPSGHKLTHFNRDNGGKIPSNLIVASNAASDGQYFRYCKENGLPIHPARFPNALPAFFIEFLTEKGDWVWDLFAGSGVTAEECYKRERNFIINDKSLTYLKGSMGRFTPMFMRTNETLLSL